MAKTKTKQEIGAKLQARAKTKTRTKTKTRPKTKEPDPREEIMLDILSTDHACAWRAAALKLAACVVTVLRTDGKIGIGSGLVMKCVDGKTVIERWDKDFIKALALIGVEVGPKIAPNRRRRRRTSALAE